MHHFWVFTSRERLNFLLQVAISLSGSSPHVVVLGILRALLCGSSLWFWLWPYRISLQVHVQQEFSGGLGPERQGAETPRAFCSLHQKTRKRTNYSLASGVRVLFFRIGLLAKMPNSALTCSTPARVDSVVEPSVEGRVFNFIVVCQYVLWEDKKASYRSAGDLFCCTFVFHPMLWCTLNSGEWKGNQCVCQKVPRKFYRIQSKTNGHHEWTRVGVAKMNPENLQVV